MPEDAHDLSGFANPRERSLQWHAPVLHCFDAEDAETGVSSVVADAAAQS